MRFIADTASRGRAADRHQKAGFATSHGSQTHLPANASAGTDWRQGITMVAPRANWVTWHRIAGGGFTISFRESPERRRSSRVAPAFSDLTKLLPANLSYSLRSLRQLSGSDRSPRHRIEVFSPLAILRLTRVALFAGSRQCLRERQRVTFSRLACHLDP